MEHLSTIINKGTIAQTTSGTVLLTLTLGEKIDFHAFLFQHRFLAAWGETAIQKIDK